MTVHKIALLEKLRHQYEMDVQFQTHSGLCSSIHQLYLLDTEERKFLYGLIEKTAKDKKILYTGIMGIKFKRGSEDGIKNNYFLWSLDDIEIRFKWIDSKLRYYRKKLKTI